MSLYFLRETGIDCPILRIGLSRFPPLDHYRLGQCIAQAVENLGSCAVFIASGDLSHKLRDDGPYGFAPEGPEFDRQAAEMMAAGLMHSAQNWSAPVWQRKKSPRTPGSNWPGCPWRPLSPSTPMVSFGVALEQPDQLRRTWPGKLYRTQFPLVPGTRASHQ